MTHAYMVLMFFCLGMCLWQTLKQELEEVVAAHLGCKAERRRDIWLAFGFILGAYLCIIGLWGERLNQLDAPGGPEVKMVASGALVADREEMRIFFHWLKFRPRALYVPKSHDCDDFALEYYYALKLHGFRAGYTTSAKGRHAWNCVELSDGRLIHWEPQTGMVYRMVPSDTHIAWDPEEVKRSWVFHTLLEGDWKSQIYALLFCRN